MNHFITVLRKLKKSTNCRLRQFCVGYVGKPLQTAFKINRFEITIPKQIPVILIPLNNQRPMLHHQARLKKLFNCRAEMNNRIFWIIFKLIYRPFQKVEGAVRKMLSHLNFYCFLTFRSHFQNLHKFAVKNHA